MLTSSNCFILDAFPDEATDGCKISDVEEMAGHGIKANVEGRIVCVGNTKMMDAVGAKWRDCHHVGTIIHVAIDGEYAGHIVINDKVKADSAEAIAQLQSLGVAKTVMLTGDRKEVAEKSLKDNILPSLVMVSMMPLFWRVQMSVSLWADLALMPLSRLLMWC